MKKLELYYPTRPMIATQIFGVNKDYYLKEFGVNGHNGIDYSIKNNNVIRAAHDGIVTFIGEDGAGGVGVVIRTLETFAYENTETYFKTIYWHLEPNTFMVKVGDTVRAGQYIALGDNTGKSTGPHLHFGLKPVAKGEQDWSWYNYAQNNGFLGAIDPQPYFTGVSSEFANTWNLIRKLTSDILVWVKILTELVKRS